MKNYGIKTLFLIIIVPYFLFSNSVILSDSSDQPTRITLLEQNDDYIIIEYVINNFEINEIVVNGELFHQIKLDKEPNFISQKTPDLPHINRSLIIPDNSSINISMISKDFVRYNNINVIPSKGNLPRNININAIPYIKGEIYNKNSYFPGKLFDIHNPYILRDFRGQVIQLNPFQYNPITKNLNVYHKVVLKIEFNGFNMINQILNRKSNSTFIKDYYYLYSDRFLNFSSYKTRYDPIFEDGEMLIICYDSFCDEMNSFVDWKNQKGIRTTLVPKSVAGNTYNAIKDYVEEFYNNHNLAYLLLVGDSNQIPSKSTGSSWSSGESDPWYSYITNDSYPEFFVGRFSAENTSHVQTQVQRSIEYERDSQSNANWYKKGVMIASNEGPGDDNEDDWEHARNLRELLLDYTYSSIDELYDGNHSSGGSDANGNPSSTSLRNILNDGRGILHYTGHGETTYFVTTNFGTSDVNSLTNNNELPFACAVGCISGNFAGSTCLAESFQRSTNNNEPTGAIASFMSTIYMGWSPPMEAQDEMVDILVESYSNNRKYSFGGISFNGCLKMNDSYGSEGYVETDHWTIFGDPSIALRTDTPSILSVSHDGSIDPSDGAYEVIINGNDNNVIAALSNEGEYLGSSYASNGSCVIILEEDISDFSHITLTVTGYNTTTIIDNVTVGNACPGYTAGDMNGDNNTNVQDIIIMVNIILGLVTPDSCQLEYGDLNSDEIFNILDIVSLVSLILG